MYVRKFDGDHRHFNLTRRVNFEEQPGSTSGSPQASYHINREPKRR
jgi:hypothetical protein